MNPVFLSEVETAAFFEMLVEKFGNLEIFTYKGYFPSLANLQRFVAANPRLRTVQFEGPPGVSGDIQCGLSESDELSLN